jgi:predicted ArsR family transcriptional regulator
MSRVHRGPKALTWVLSALGEPNRRRAYEAVLEARRPVSRVDVAKALGIGVRLAAFHLDKLVDEGLLSTYFARQEGRRGGPGSGRPPKWYVASPQGFDITLPPRRNDLAAGILLHAVAGSAGSRQRVMEEARRRGRILAEQTPGQDLEPLLSGLGYEPRPAPGECIDLLNCPFHELAETERETVCSMNLALLQGVTEVVAGAHVAVPEQRAGYCCVRLVPDERAQRRSAPERTAGPSF